jgi:hypothetical protein
VKTEPLLAVAVNVTVMPEAMLAVQVLPQLMPVGEEVTVPVPLPVFVTVSVYAVSVGCVANVAVTLLAPLTTSVHVPVPVQAPPQPEKVEPEFGVALRARLVPLATFALQVLPQSMALGLEATVPPPLPFLLTATVYRVALGGVPQASLEGPERPTLL